MRSSEDDALITLILSPKWAWDFPASNWEASVVAELLQMPVYDIKRFPHEELARVGVRLNACHENAREIVERHPGAEAVAGWLVEQPDFAVHSVVKMNGHYLCVTPSRSGDDECAFMPDPKHLDALSRHVGAGPQWKGDRRPGSAPTSRVHDRQVQVIS